MFLELQTCDHDSSDVSLQELVNDRSGLWLQSVLEHQEPQEGQVPLHLLSSGTMSTGIFSVSEYEHLLLGKFLYHVEIKLIN